MQVRNVLIAAGALVVSLSALAASVTAASAQGYDGYGRSYQPRYEQSYRPIQPAFAYYSARDGFEQRVYWEHRREEERRHDFWERHRAYDGFRGW